MLGVFWNVWMVSHQAVFIGMFTGGSALLWFSLLGRLRMGLGRASRLALMLERMKKRERDFLSMEKELETLSPKARAFAEKARLAGLPSDWGYYRFQILRSGMALSLLSLGFVAQVANLEGLYSLSAGSWIWITLKGGICVAVGWWMPLLFVHAVASQRKGEYLMEIAKLAERLSVCVSEKADIRDMLIRAGRPLKLLSPHLQELTINWGRDRRAAIWRFKEAVGISEVFPLVNALEAISQADAKEVAQVLKEQTESIETTLAAEINRRIENAPVWISFYIMIPFGMIVLLFLYPWVITISKQLMTSFQG
ncbi:MULTISPECIES: hypothetical protein [unclassified Paenibacillus]|uniref:hypothetical protein n=1 Tax=unclassified Paenibacillus TaxID=185978 RepID=UPI001AE7EBC3|nr:MULTISPECIES: hypothetical protein [unclassified Paenibacillus]MBP1157127.1 hypothetical protein [Paenibacillus sp. PvP091]MBP1172134.1 hypothetical protein [Paenibacillus sp. PvR098]MBP2438515.1 hypothetical protein [Paenibacillus sp. PvP052]